MPPASFGWRAIRAQRSGKTSFPPGDDAGREFIVSADRECLVEPDGIEPTTSCLQSTRSTN